MSRSDVCGVGVPYISHDAYDVPTPRGQTDTAVKTLLPATSFVSINREIFNGM